MNTIEYMSYLTTCVKAQIPSVTLAKPGIGKTQLVRQLARNLGRPLHVIEGAYIDEVALQGLPFSVDGYTKWLPPESLRMEDNAIVFIDEITTCPVQQLLYQVMLERRVDTYKFPAGVSVLAAGNREEDAGASYHFNPVLGNRVSLNMEYDGPTAAEWVKWALHNNVAAPVVAGINFVPEWLNKYDPELLRNPTPRSWELASRAINAGMNIHTALRTTVGQQAADAMDVIVAESASMVSPEAILAGNAKPPEAIMPTWLALANMNRFMQGDMQVHEAINCLEFARDCIDRHGESLASVAVTAISRVQNIHYLKEYGVFVKMYQRYL